MRGSLEPTPLLVMSQGLFIASGASIGTAVDLDMAGAEAGEAAALLFLRQVGERAEDGRCGGCLTNGNGSGCLVHVEVDWAVSGPNR